MRRPGCSNARSSVTPAPSAGRIIAANSRSAAFTSIGVAWRLLAAEGEQVAHQCGAALGAAADVFQLRLDRCIGAMFPHQLHGTQDGGQQIVEVVRDAADKMADGLQLPALRQLRLEPDLGRDVGDAQEQAADGAVRLPDQAATDIGATILAGIGQQQPRGQLAGRRAAGQQSLDFRPGRGAFVWREDAGSRRADRQIGFGGQHRRSAALTRTMRPPRSISSKPEAAPSNSTCIAASERLARSSSTLVGRAVKSRTSVARDPEVASPTMSSALSCRAYRSAGPYAA